jgi:hypothetical protein
MHNMTTQLTTLQLTVARTLLSLDGVACEADLLATLERTTRFTRASGSFACAELVAMGAARREGNVVGLTCEIEAELLAA